MLLSLLKPKTIGICFIFHQNIDLAYWKFYCHSTDNSRWFFISMVQVLFNYNLHADVTSGLMKNVK